VRHEVSSGCTLEHGFARRIGAPSEGIHSSSVASIEVGSRHKITKRSLELKTSVFDVQLKLEHRHQNVCIRRWPLIVNACGFMQNYDIVRTSALDNMPRIPLADAAPQESSLSSRAYIIYASRTRNVEHRRTRTSQY